MLKLLYNLFAIGKNLPAIIAIIKSLIDIIGSAQVQSVLESIKSALKKEIPTPDDVPKTESERLRLIDRVRQRLGLAWLGMSDADYTAFCRIKNVSGKIEHFDA